MNALPEKNRLARNIREGYEIEVERGRWVRVVSTLHIVSPLALVRFEMADSFPFSAYPDTRLRSRRLAEATA